MAVSKDENSNRNNPTILFVGAFKRPLDGTLGGQLFACRTLLDSDIFKGVQWKLVDTSQRSLPPPPLRKRLLPAFVRLAKSTEILRRPNTEAGLVFTSYRTYSLLEKISICIVGQYLGKQMTVSFRSEIVPIGTFPKAFQPLIKKLLSKAFDLGTQVVCQSQAAKSNLTRAFPQAKTFVVQNWIEMPPHLQIVKTSPTSPDRSTRTATTTKPTILFLGWLEANKGVSYLLHAVAELKNRGLEVALRIGGSGSQKKVLEELTASLGLKDDVTFLGWIAGDDKASEYRKADVFALPSFSEGMPNAILEAMAYGLPVVATPVGGVSELVCKAGSALVPPGDSKQLADALAPLISDKSTRQRMGDENRLHAKRRHDIKVVLPELAAILGLPTKRENQTSSAQINPNNVTSLPST